DSGLRHQPDGEQPPMAALPVALVAQQHQPVCFVAPSDLLQDAGDLPGAVAIELAVVVAGELVTGAEVRPAGSEEPAPWPFLSFRVPFRQAEGNDDGLPHIQPERPV